MKAGEQGARYSCVKKNILRLYILSVLTKIEICSVDKWKKKRYFCVVNPVMKPRNTTQNIGTGRNENEKKISKNEKQISKDEKQISNICICYIFL